jgi:hypothetical protein
MHGNDKHKNSGLYYRVLVIRLRFSTNYRMQGIIAIRNYKYLQRYHCTARYTKTKLFYFFTYV